MDYTMPEGYGQARINASSHCGGNFHFINTQDLLLDWEGFNNPNGSKQAAAKACAECWYEPTRADGLCNEWGDGSFICCFTDSRCLVNNPEDKSKKKHRMRGTFYYKRDFTDYKFVQVNLIDIGGGGRTENGQQLDIAAEWNVASNLNNVGTHTQCNDTVCTMTESITVGDGSKFGYGYCAGDMIWSYIHVHGGTIGGNIVVNGEQVCEIYPHIGKDLNNTAGDEAGYLVGMSMCVDYRETGKKLRLNKGDILTATATYDVDQGSTRYFPSPGGKHGGIMGLFFSMMECDEGTWNEIYVRRGVSCVGTPRSKSSVVGTFYNDRASCEAQTNPQSPAILKIAPPVVVEETLPQFGKLQLILRDCGSESKLSNMTGVTPAVFGIGGYTDIKVTGTISREVTTATYQLKMSSGAAGLTLLDFGGDVSQGLGKWTLKDQIHMEWLPMKTPIKAGAWATKLRLFVDPAVPVAFGHTTTTVIVRDQDGLEIACAEVATPTLPDMLVV